MSLAEEPQPLLARPPLPQRESRAVVSFVLGLLSLVTFGLTAIPAVAFGISARSSIERSGGALRGTRIAVAGIATGLAGAIVSMVAAVAFVAGVYVSTQLPQVGTARSPVFALLPASPGPAVAWTPATPSLAAEPMSVGSIRVMDVDPNAKQTFHQQLADEYQRAESAHQTLVVMTSARWCTVCKEIEAALPDPRMQAALANVDLVRADVDDFEDELHQAGMLEDTLPWFYKVDGSLRPVDAISAGEWDENVPENMAPVLRSFLAGTLSARRDPSAMGTSL